MTGHAAQPFLSRASRMRQWRRRLTPWLLGLAGFSFTATAMLLQQDHTGAGRVAALAEQFSAIAPQ